MSQRTAFLRHVPIFAQLLLCACAEPSLAPDVSHVDLPNDRVWASAHFRYHTRLADSLEPEIVNTAEQHFTALQAYLGFLWPTEHSIDYYKYLDARDLKRNGTCSDFNNACFFAKLGVQSDEPLNTHELIHAYLQPLGTSHRLLEEGLAESLSCGARVRPRPTPAKVQTAFEPLAWRFGTAAQFRTLYDSATWFVGHLLRVYGPKPFMIWYRLMHEGSALADAAALFEQSYPLTLEAAWLQAFTSEDPETGCVRAWECATDDPPDWVHSLDVANPTWAIQTGPGNGLLLSNCPETAQVAHQGWIDPAFGGQRGETFVVWLRSGRYFWFTDSGSLDSELKTRSVELYNPAASRGGPVPALDFTNNATFALPPAAGAVVREVSWDESDHAGSGYRMECSPNTTAELCSEQGECSPACDSIVRREAFGDTSVRRIAIVSDRDHAAWVRLTRTR